jgi:hypothetical protein
MAGAGYRLFNTGDVLTAAQVNTYLQQQVIMVFADSTARTTALSGVLAEGMFSYLTGTNAFQYYDGAAWADVSNPGDITGVTAGTGLSGGGSSGAVTLSIDTATTADLTTAQTLTNKKLSDSTTTIVDVADATKAVKFDVGGTTAITGTIATNFTTAKTVTIPDATGTLALTSEVINNSLVTTAGDIIYRNATVPVRLGIGTANQVLAVNSGATAPEWKTISTTPTFVGVNATRTNVSTAVTANTEILVAFTGEEFDTNGFHDNSTNNSRLTIPSGYGGKYIVAAYCNNPNTPGAYQLLRLFKNGVLYTTGGVREGEYVRNQTGTGNCPFGFSQTITTAAADYWEIKYQQNATETVNMFFNFQLTYVGV